MSRFHPENEPARCDCHLKDQHPIIGCQRVPGTNANAHAPSCPRYIKFNLHPTALALEAAK